MIEPMKALVRPRVILPNGGDSVLLEDLVEDLIKSGDVSEIELHGRRGAGTTTALQHIAYLFGLSSGVQFAEQRRPTGNFASLPSGSILISSLRSNSTPDVLKCNLAGWGRDEWIEYLLVTNNSRCGSVMTRLQNDTMVRLLDGNPNIFRQVLEELAADEDLAGVQAALHRIMNQHFCNVKVRRVLAKGVFGRVLDGLDEYNLLTTIVINGLSIEQARLLSVPGVILKFAEESAWDFLEQKFPSGPLLTKWQRGLIDAVATRVAVTPTMQAKLQAWIDSKQRYLQPLAVSLLHVANVAWKWPEPKGVRNRAGLVSLNGAILDGADCTKLPLSDCVMCEASFERALLTGVDLQDSNATSAQFDHADLKYAVLNNFNSSKASFVRANLSHASGHRANLSRVDLSFAKLADVQFHSCDFSDADLRSADFSRSLLQFCIFKGARLDGADFSQANLERANLRGLDLTVANFREASFLHAQLDGCTLAGMELAAANFAFADLKDAEMTGSVMPRATFVKAALCEAKLAEIEWESADLRDADLTGATFHMGSSRSGLIESDIPMLGSRTGFYTDELQEQDFKAPEEIRKANLRGADLRGAIIDGVDFYLVDLRDALYDPDQGVQFRRTGAILATRAC